MRMRLAVAGALMAWPGACGGDAASDLPIAAAPTTPLPTLPMANDLSPVGPTTFVGAPGDTAILRVRATRTGGIPVIGVVVVFQVQAGGGAVKPFTTTTDYDGLASAQWTLGPAPAVNLATAAGGVATSPVSFSVSTFPDSTAAP